MWKDVVHPRRYNFFHVSSYTAPPSNSLPWTLLLPFISIRIEEVEGQVGIWGFVHCSWVRKNSLVNGRPLRPLQKGLVTYSREYRELDMMMIKPL